MVGDLPALGFRTIDSAIRATLSAGTHYLWHVLNARPFFAVSLLVICRYGAVNP